MPDFEMPEWGDVALRRLSAWTPYGNTPQQWLIAAALLLASLLVLRLVQALLRRRLRREADRPEQDWADSFYEAVQETRFWFLLVAAAYLGSQALSLPEKERGLIAAVTIAALLVQFALWVNRLLVWGIAREAARRVATDAATAMTISAAGFLLRIALWAVVLLMILANFGVNVTALIAGLGIGGIAVALAAQNILSDLFASLTIVLDKPFVVGDFIIVGDFLGTVENVGLKTTRIRSLSGEQLIFPNNDLLQSRIRNMKRMKERRVLFNVGVVYETPPELLERISGMLREIVESQHNVRFDRAHFQRFGDFSLVFEVVYFVLVPEHAVMMDTQQRINLAISRRFAAEGISFAYPTQRLLLQRLPAAEKEEMTE